MKSVSIRVALFAMALATPALMLAGGQPIVRKVTRNELQYRPAARAISQGKGSGITRRQPAEHPNTQPAVRSYGTGTAFTK